MLKLIDIEMSEADSMNQEPKPRYDAECVVKKTLIELTIYHYLKLVIKIFTSEFFQIKFF